MAATETGQRSIVRGCKFQPIARVIQHEFARAVISRFLWDESMDVAYLMDEADTLRNRLADTPFDRDLFDHNADYLERFAEIHKKVAIPAAEICQAEDCPAIAVNGVKVTAGLHFRLSRTTRTNKVRIGGGMLRYAKSKALPERVGQWQSAFIFGYLSRSTGGEDAAPEHKLCLTVDAYSGEAWPAPSDSVRRFSQMEVGVHDHCRALAQYTATTRCRYLISN